jgi:hypothetical protein
MFNRRIRFVTTLLLSTLLVPALRAAQQNQVLAELQFAGTTKVEQNSGVWIDGQYLGFLKELKDDKKVMLLPGEHEITVRQAGYKDFTDKVRVEPAETRLLTVTMQRDPNVKYPGKDAATLKLHIEPDRAAVFLDDGYVGHVSDFGGAFRSMEVSPGKHQIKVALPGYKTFETEINLLPQQKSEIKTGLVKGTTDRTAPLVRE